MPFYTSISTQMKTYKQQQSRSTSNSGNSLKTHHMDVWGSATEVNLRRWLRDALLWKGQPGLIAIPTPELWGLIESVSFLTDFFESIKVKEVCACVHACDSECVDVCGLCLWANAEPLPFSSGPYFSYFLCAVCDANLGQTHKDTDANRPWIYFFIINELRRISGRMYFNCDTLCLFSNSFAAISLHITQDFCIVFTSGTAMDADPPTPSPLLIRWEASKTLRK